MNRSPSLAAAALFVALQGPAYAGTDWQAVGTALGKPGTVMPGDIYRVGLPRTDLHVTLDGVALEPGFALGSWLAFEGMGNDVMVMGDLVLTENEVAPVMTKLIAGGIAITALHNHLLRAAPATMYMHVLGHGEPLALAETLHAALGASETPLPAPGAPAAQSSQATAATLDTAAIEQGLGHKGQMNGRVYQVSVPRAEPVLENGMEVPPAMGSAIAINFQPAGEGRAAVTGDFVLIAAEVNPVLQALREHGIEVTALHNHMLEEQPRLFFMHFWGVAETGKLAEDLKAALDKVNVATN
jgi:hypothetical protein